MPLQSSSHPFNKQLFSGLLKSPRGLSFVGKPKRQSMETVTLYAPQPAPTLLSVSVAYSDVLEHPERYYLVGTLQLVVFWLVKLTFFTIGV
jgi:hypothetical protein